MKYVWLLLAPACGLMGVAHAQSYPVKPLRIVVPQSAGGLTDLTARLIAQKLSEVFKPPA